MATWPSHRIAAQSAGYGRLALFSAGLATILVALVSPIDVLGEQLLVMHMVQHILLLDIAPILLILGLNKGLLRPVTRRVQALERRAGLLATPAFAVVCYVGSCGPGTCRRCTTPRCTTPLCTRSSTPASSPRAPCTGGT